MREKKLIQLYVTNMCNSHCKTCGIWRNKQRQELDVKDIEKVIKAFPDAGYVIGGGEAILHRDIDIMLYILQRNNVNYTLLSNCILYGRLCELVEMYDVPAITISFDGIKHNEIRGVNDNINNIISFKSWCDMKGIPMKVSYTYSKFNEDLFEEDMTFIKRTIGCEEIYFCIAQDMDLLKTNKNDESFVANNFEQILECNLISEKDKKHIRGMISGIRRCCTSQNNVHTIYSNGDIVRCQSFKSKEVLGNIKCMTVEEIEKTLNSIDNERCQFDGDCDLLCQRRYD